MPLVEALAADVGFGSVLIIQIDPGVFGQVPVEIGPADIELLVFHTPAPVAGSARAPKVTPNWVADPQIATTVSGLVGSMDIWWGNAFYPNAVSPYSQALKATDFHAEGSAGAGGLMVNKATGQGVTFFPATPGKLWGTNARNTTYGPNVVINTTTRYHTLLLTAEAADLQAGTVFDASGNLVEGAKTALHELIHVVLDQQGQGAKDDSGDAFVGNLDNLVVQKVEMENSRDSNGVPEGQRVQRFSQSLNLVQNAWGSKKGYENL